MAGPKMVAGAGSEARGDDGDGGGANLPWITGLSVGPPVVEDVCGAKVAISVLLGVGNFALGMLFRDENSSIYL